MDKQYYIDKKEAKLKYQKQYTEDNRARLNACKREKIHCDCDCMISRNNIATHCKSLKHKKYVESL